MKTLPPLALAATLLGLAGSAHAASPDAWEQFRAQVAEQCATAAKLQHPFIRLDPFGTQSYGIARVTGTAEDGHWATVVCVLRKTPDGPVDVEVSAPLEDWVAAQ